MKRTRSKKASRRERSFAQEGPEPEVEEEPAAAEETSPLPAGREPRGPGRRGGEPLLLSEEEDDFENGKSSSGLYSRGETDFSSRGESGSRRGEARVGPMAVEPGEPDTTATSLPKPDYRRPPDEGGPYVPPGGLARLRKRSRPSKRLSRRPRRRVIRRPSFAG